MDDKLLRELTDALLNVPAMKTYAGRTALLPQGKFTRHPESDDIDSRLCRMKEQAPFRDQLNPGRRKLARTL